MIVELADKIKSFPGAENCVWCFNHVVALVAKSSIHQFDVPKGQADAVLDEAEKALRDLAEGVDIEEEMMLGELELPDDDENEAPEVNENEDGWVDEVAALSVVDREELGENVRPIRLVLVKVSRLFYFVCSSTYLSITIAS